MRHSAFVLLLTSALLTPLMTGCGGSTVKARQPQREITEAEYNALSPDDRNDPEVIRRLPRELRAKLIR